MSTYGQKRDDEYLNRLKSSGPISDFITSYNANLSAPHRTIFLFPGGMGSQLLRATADVYQGPPFFTLRRGSIRSSGRGRSSTCRHKHRLTTTITSNTS